MSYIKVNSIILKINYGLSESDFEADLRGFLERSKTFATKNSPVPIKTLLHNQVSLDLEIKEVYQSVKTIFLKSLFENIFPILARNSFTLSTSLSASKSLSSFFIASCTSLWNV